MPMPKTFTMFPRAYALPPNHLHALLNAGERTGPVPPRERIFNLANLALSCEEGVQLFLQLEAVCERRGMAVADAVADGLYGAAIPESETRRILAWGTPLESLSIELNHEIAERFLKVLPKAFERTPGALALEKALTDLPSFIAALIGCVHFAETIDFP